MHQALGGTGVWAAQPEVREVTEEGAPDYSVIMGDYAAEQATWESRPIRPGTPLSKPTPLFAKLDEMLGQTGPPGRRSTAESRRVGASVQIRHPEIRQGTQEAVVTPLELFFDLVFVFALTQVTAYMSDELSWHGMLRGVLVVMLLWWSWTGFAWVANVVSADEGEIKLVMLVAMAAMFLIALCIPEAFDDAPGGLSGPVVLAICYLVFRLMHLVLFWILSENDRGLRRQLRFAPAVLGGTTLLLVATRFEGWTQTALWVAALLVDYIGTALGGASGWRLPAPGTSRSATG